MELDIDRLDNLFLERTILPMNKNVQPVCLVAELDTNKGLVFPRQSSGPTDVNVSEFGGTAVSQLPIDLVEIGGSSDHCVAGRGIGTFPTSNANEGIAVGTGTGAGAALNVDVDLGSSQFAALGFVLHNRTAAGVGKEIDTQWTLLRGTASPANVVFASGLAQVAGSYQGPISISGVLSGYRYYRLSLNNATNTDVYGLTVFHVRDR